MNEKLKILMILTLFVVGCFIVSAQVPGWRLVEDNVDAYIDLTNGTLTHSVNGTIVFVVDESGNINGTTLGNLDTDSTDDFLKTGGTLTGDVVSDKGETVAFLRDWGVGHSSANDARTVYFVHDNSTDDFVCFLYSGPDEETCRFSPTLATFPGELNVNGIAGAGSVLCVKGDGNIGNCDSAVNATGLCNCV